MPERMAIDLKTCHRQTPVLPKGICILRSSLVIIVACMCQWLFFVGAAFAADECEVVKASYYQRMQGEIVTGWTGGASHKKYQKMVYPCADVTVRDTYGSAFMRVVEIAAVFSDQSTASKKAWCDKKNIENEVIYFCIVCFQSDFPVSSLTCNFSDFR
jgi:hypothetical protein